MKEIHLFTYHGHRHAESHQTCPDEIKDPRKYPLQDSDLTNNKQLVVFFIYPVGVLGTSLPYLCDIYNILQYVVSTGRLFIIFRVMSP